MLDTSQRKGLASALYGLGNIVAAALMVGQFVGATPFRARLFVLGLVLWAGTYLIATRLNKENKEEGR